jgi:hypothetical protein
MIFRAGDVVHNTPSGEKWTLALDEIDGYIYWCGHPFGGCGRAGNCTIIEQASDEKR